MASKIDKIFYINLDRRSDRRDLIEMDLAKIGLAAERFVGIPYEPGIVGCGKSHLAVMKIAKERGYKNVLILEDDFIFLESKEVVEENIQKLFTEKPDFDVCFLAYNLQRGNVVPELPFLIKADETHSASAYILNQHYYDKLIDLYEWAMPILEDTLQHWIYANDQVWKRFQEADQWYCFTIRLGKQADGYSDNSNRFNTYEC